MAREIIWLATGSIFDGARRRGADVATAIPPPRQCCSKYLKVRGQRAGGADRALGASRRDR
jgi:hypothetical protein